MKDYEDKINRIRDLREDEDLTQEDLAEKLGYHTTTYQRWEQSIHNIKLKDAANIADFYGVSLDYIAGRTNDKRGIGYTKKVNDKHNVTPTNNENKYNASHNNSGNKYNITQNNNGGMNSVSIKNK